jgi:hypothetical protein
MKRRLLLLAELPRSAWLELPGYWIVQARAGQWGDAGGAG